MLQETTHTAGLHERLFRAPQGEHPIAVSLLRPAAAERSDSALSATGAGDRLLQYLSGGKTCDTRAPDRHRRSVPGLDNHSLAKMGRAHPGGAGRPPG